VVTDRGQAHTLEASVAALLLLVSIGIALQMTAVTPLSASTSSQHLENQLEETATGVLASSAESGELKSAILYWNSSASTFHGATTEYYYTESLPQTLSLGQTLTRTLDERERLRAHCLDRREETSAEHAVDRLESVYGRVLAD
jgi:hypothetical protein